MPRKPNCECCVCGTRIYRRPQQIQTGDVYCSLACFGIAQRTHKQCPVCGKELINSRNKRTCSRACANRYRTGIRYTGAARKDKDKVKTAAALKARLVQERGGVCERCGYSQTHILVVHHKVRKCDGGTNDMNNLELICPNCHAEIHYGGVAEPG